MHVPGIDIKRALAGKSVLGVLAVVLVISGMTSTSVFVVVGEHAASMAATLVPAASSVPELLVVLGIYLQAVLLAAVYRVCHGVYTTLQRRRRRVTSA